MNKPFEIIDVEPNQVRVKGTSGVTVVARHEDEGGVYILDQNLQKQYVTKTVKEIQEIIKKELAKFRSEGQATYGRTAHVANKEFRAIDQDGFIDESNDLVDIYSKPVPSQRDIKLARDTYSNVSFDAFLYVYEDDADVFDPDIMPEPTDYYLSIDLRTGKVDTL